MMGRLLLLALIEREIDRRRRDRLLHCLRKTRTHALDTECNRIINILTHL
jgi:hypothetical protein